MKNILFLLFLLISTIDIKAQKVFSVKYASQADIKKAYLSKAKVYHPDRNHDDPKAAEKFREISAAYEELSNAKAKLEYDGQM